MVLDLAVVAVEVVAAIVVVVLAVDYQLLNRPLQRLSIYLLLLLMPF
jgi:hypothetical protein